MLESSVVTDSVSTVSLPYDLTLMFKLCDFLQEGKITTSIWFVGTADHNKQWHLSACDLLDEAKLEEEAKLKEEAELKKEAEESGKTASG